MIEGVGTIRARGLRVAIRTADEGRRRTLTDLVRQAGHAVVEGRDAPDAVLSDRDLPLERTCPSIVLGAVETDAEGLLPAGASAAQLDAALCAVAQGLMVRPRLTPFSGFRSEPEEGARAALTPREAQVLDALADGLTNKAIARRLGISLHTVKFHLESVFRKLSARTRTEAVARALERRREETINL